MQTVCNHAWERRAAKPALSVLVPYFRFDCCRLVAELLSQAEGLQQPVELLLADDGSVDSALNDKLHTLIEKSDVPVHWQIYAENRGRARIRNALQMQASADYLLFLDCDMLPDHEDFLERYQLEIQTHPEVMAFIGGRSYQQLDKVKPEQALYLYFSQRTECVSVQKRQMRAAWYFYTNNVVIKRKALLEEPFDDYFDGWGFEDIDIGLRIAKLGSLRHIDNTATHLGLMKDEDILKKYDQSVDNFLRILAKHPEEMRLFKITKTAKKLKNLKATNKLFHKILDMLVKQIAVPVHIRYLALQLYRANLYSKHL